MQDKTNRQNSVKSNDLGLSLEFQVKQKDLVDQALKYYKDAIDSGIAKEQARCFLPEGLTVSRLYMNGTMRSWIHYIQLRSANGTQKEHMDVAVECGKVLSTIFPFITKILKNK